VAGLGVCVVASSLNGCGQKSKISNLADLRQLANQGKLSVGFIPYYEITTDHGPNSKPTGFLVEVFSMFAHKANFSIDNIQWCSITWASFGAAVKSGAVDFSIAGTFVTPARSEVVAFSRPLFALGNGAVTKKGDARFASVKDVGDLDKANLRIAVVAGEQSAEYVDRHFKNAKILVLNGPDLAVAPLAVEQGLADVAMSDQFILSRYVNAHPNLTDILAKRPFSILPIAWAVSKENTGLLAEVNPILDNIVASADYKNLQARYPVIPFANLSDS
jgi:ABC-type amino acid transport substrate-binding protein